MKLKVKYFSNFQAARYYVEVFYFEKNLSGRYLKLIHCNVIIQCEAGWFFEEKKLEEKPTSQSLRDALR